MTDTLEPSDGDPLDEIAFEPSDAEIGGLPDASRIYIRALEAAVEWRDARLKAIDARPVVKALVDCTGEHELFERWHCGHFRYKVSHKGNEFVVTLDGEGCVGSAYKRADAQALMVEHYEKSVASLISQCLEPADPVVSEDEEWSSEIVPNRRGWGWIARVFLNGELDHERAFESLDAATEHAEHFAALTPTEGGE